MKNRGKYKKKANPKWREDLATIKQMEALMNMSEAWKIPLKDVKTKGEADAEIKRLIAEIAELKNKPNEHRENTQKRERVDDPVPVFRKTPSLLPQWGEWS